MVLRLYRSAQVSNWAQSLAYARVVFCDCAAAAVALRVLQQLDELGADVLGQLERQICGGTRRAPFGAAASQPGTNYCHPSGCPLPSIPRKSTVGTIVDGHR
jgi:hypothetical protein